MQIAEATIHRLIKATNTSGEGSVQKKLREANLPVDVTLETVVTDLITLYAKSVDSQGTFGDDENIHVFPVRFTQYLSGSLGFQEMASVGLSLIADKMEDALFANGGYALFVRYTYQQHDFFLVAMLKLRPGAGIDEETLSLEPTLSIDLDRLNEAARVNITRMNDGIEPYLTFIKGKRNRTQVTDYFRSALSCTSFTSSAHHTQQLMQAADAYVARREDLPDELARQSEKIDMRQRLFDYFNSNADEVTLETAAAHIHPNKSDDFIRFVKGEGEQPEFQIDDAFKPDKRTYKKLQRISATMGSVRVSFSVQDVQDGTVTYDVSHDAIIIRSPSEKLKREIIDNECPVAP
jgi:nucleoid-associated protein